MKRNLFAELKDGMAALAAEREGKVTLRKVALLHKSRCRAAG